MAFANAYTGGTTVNSGARLIASTDNALPSGHALVNNGTTDVEGSDTLSSLTGTGTLNISPGSDATSVVKLAVGSGLATEGGLTIAANSLDITNNHIIISYAPGTQAAADAAIRSYLIAGRNGGTWNGTTGIITTGSTGAGVDTGYGIGYADGADGVVKVTGANPAGLSTGQIEVKYTLLGDANLDGLVSGDDFTILGTHLGPGTSNATWDEGDFTYTGLVNGDDFTDLVKNLGKSASGADVVQLPAADYAAIDAFAAANGLMADVPEPASAGMLVAAGLCVTARRKRCPSK